MSKKKQHLKPRNQAVLDSFTNQGQKLYSRLHKNKKDILNNRKKLKEELKNDEQF